MHDNDRKTDVILSVIGVVPVVWLALLIAPYIDKGLPAVLSAMSDIMSNPFKIQICEDSLKAVLVLLLSYVLCLGVYFGMRKNYRRGEEHGSAKWGNAAQINKKYMQKPKSNNKIMTQHIMIGLDGRKHRRNLNTLVIGGSGAGKTRFYCLPNIMQCNTSFVVLDPNGYNIIGHKKITVHRLQK